MSVKFAANTCTSASFKNEHLLAMCPFASQLKNHKMRQTPITELRDKLAEEVKKIKEEAESEYLKLKSKYEGSYLDYAKTQCQPDNTTLTIRIC